MVVKRALEGLDGVQEAVVSFKEKTAVIRYDDQKVDVRQMTEAVRQAGFTVLPTE
ncbi:MAG: heavy-metal-associated domain-containing protein [Deltaproteobacteria bacterium]|nr:heavy-metal-associated domain-containing protein [Deltaproteobacteria bacterium]